MRILLFALFGRIISKIYHKIKCFLASKKQRKVENKFPVLSEIPDLPCGFGYKICWLAIKTQEPQAVISELQCNNVRCANWQTGIEAAYTNKAIFISPAINGFVLVVGVPPMDEMQDTLLNLAAKFDEVLYFGSHRVIDYCGWAKYKSGKLIRAYEWLGERGEVIQNFGALTEEETSLNYMRFIEINENIEETECPTEEDVIELARLWSVDPLFSNGCNSKSTGFVCRTT